MKIKIIQTIVNTLDFDRTLIKTSESEVYSLTPDKGKVLVYIPKDEEIDHTITVSRYSDISNYIEKTK